VLRGENITVDKEQKIKLIEYIKNYYPDLRRIINDIQKFSYSGKLNISLDSVNSIAKRLLDKILKKESATNLRKFIIENESHFSGNYLTLLRQLFEEVFTLQINEQIKSSMLKCISEKMFRDSFVVDKEINSFTVCLELLEILT
jgi:DNA polymerase III delta prime subunit